MTDPTSRPSGASTEPHPDVKALASWLRGAYGHAFPRVDWESDAGEILDLFASDWRAGAASTEATPPPVHAIGPGYCKTCEPGFGHNNPDDGAACPDPAAHATEATERPDLRVALKRLVDMHDSVGAESAAHTADVRDLPDWRSSMTECAGDGMGNPSTCQLHRDANGHLGLWYRDEPTCRAASPSVEGGEHAATPRDTPDDPKGPCAVCGERIVWSWDAGWEHATEPVRAAFDSAITETFGMDLAEITDDALDNAWSRFRAALTGATSPSEPSARDVSELGFYDLLDVAEAIMERAYPPHPLLCSHDPQADIGARTTAAIADLIATCRAGAAPEEERAP